MNIIFSSSLLLFSGTLEGCDKTSRMDDNMDLMKIRKYFLNCFILFIPIIIWNLIFVKYLPKSYAPDIFWKDIPSIIGTTEKVLRIIVFLLPTIMIFSLAAKIQKIGFAIYILGILLYFLSWIIQIYFPETFWSKSLLGFMAPAYTTIIWFIGIGLIGQKTFFSIPLFSKIYYMVISIFVIFHSIHTYIVFTKL